MFCMGIVVSVELCWPHSAPFHARHLLPDAPPEVLTLIPRDVLLVGPHVSPVSGCCDTHGWPCPQAAAVPCGCWANH